MDLKIIEPRTGEDWEKYYELRWRILRAPWDQPRGSEVDETDAHSTNVLILDDSERAVSVGRLHLNTPEEAQVRYVAVESGLQGRGIGKMLMHELERHAGEQGARKVVLHARDNALQFYKSLGYGIVSESYLLFGSIQHYLMEKELV